MTSGDNHDDDAQLQQLRAVWVSMRDEEPPDRGLSSLMAAARTKAAELEQAASPTWWQRIAATLWRPPVLALATVTLLLGGALIVTQRSAQMKVDATARLETETTTEGHPAGPAAGSSAVVDRGFEATIAAEPLAEPLADPPKVRDAKPPMRAKPKSVAVSPSRAPDADAVTSGGAPPPLSIAQDDALGASPEVPQQTPKTPIARTPAPPIVGEDRVTAKDSALPTVAQLVKQCETAAARGDCTAVRAIAQKILTTAPATYKTKVVNNAAITRCMADAEPNSAAQ